MKNSPTNFYNGLTLKSFLIALLLIPINVYWIIQLEVVRYTHPTLIHPLSNVIFIIFWLLLIGYILNKVSPKLGIQPPELLTIYVMLCVVSSLCSHDMMEILITIMGHPFRFASPENEWRELFWKELPTWLTVQDEKVLTAYYEGASSIYTERYSHAWLAPAVAWISFIFVLMFVMLCINTLLRIQWTERERLTYPIIQLPLEMTDARSGFFKNKLMWLGFSIAALISIVNLLNSIYPAVPYIPVKRQNINQFFTGRPWNAIGGVRLSFYPFAIGISFLIPLDLLFSCWTFYWFYKIELIVGSIMGWRNLSRFPYANEQGFGAYIGLLGFALWTGRTHFKKLADHLLSPPTSAAQLDDSREPMPYRLAAAGILIGLVFLTLFSYKAGMSLWVIPIFFGIYFLLATMIARLRAELGFLVHDLHNIDPHSMIIAGFGTRRINASTLTVFSMYMFFNRAYRAHPMPQQLEALKISERRHINPRHIAVAVMLATLIGAIVVFWLLLENYYRHGADTGYYGPWALGFGRGVYRQLENWLNYPQGADLPALAFMGGGLGFTTLLMFLRTRFLWWPFHPLGYAMANSWGMYNLWCCLFVAWGLKAIILRHGGLKAYRRAIPCFLGLALGDYILGSLWSIFSILANTTLYQFWP
ncbi:hypothetical protein IH992_03180 [Candidatus Poribacteria bacterium]|nr:hypothetical protein [Candidatus Poribacteria bacterium]